jgi:hypothetical protein
MLFPPDRLVSMHQLLYQAITEEHDWHIWRRLAESRLPL